MPTKPSASAVTDRAELPLGDFALCLSLRVAGIDARLPQSSKNRLRLLTVPAAEHDRAYQLMLKWTDNGSDPIADGHTLLRRKALTVPA